MESNKKVNIQRKSFQGVRNILNFNRHFYYLSLILLLISSVFIFLLQVPSAFCFVFYCFFGYALIAPIIISAYVYDISGYYTFDWLDFLVKDRNIPFKIINIHAGFDETSFILKAKFKNSEIQVFDFYDAKKHTEASIKRARNVSKAYPNTVQIKTKNIPIEDQSYDFIFLLHSAHEIRDKEERIIFLKECRRICKSNGKVILIEHPRDLPNFLAFTIGAFHFHPSKVWKNDIQKAGFAKFNERKLTPFMSLFEIIP